MSTAVRTEERAFESLYRLNRPIVYAYALSRLRNPSDAEDVTQTTFLNAYTALNRGVTPRDDLQWLIAIARNVCRDRFRVAKRRQEEPLEEDWTPVVQAEPPEYSVGEIAKQIAELHPRHRQIILMREFEGRSYSEISAKLGVSEAAVQALLVRARRTLRDELELGISCSQARRISLRHLNGIAVRDERRALQRHLRKCDDCATFVGHRPRSLTGVLLLPTLPFRKLGTLLIGTSSTPVGTTAGGGGAMAAKVLTLTAIGSTAVGVTVSEVSTPPAPSHSPAAPKRQPAAAPIRHSSVPVRVQSPPVTTWASFRGSSAGRPPLPHATANRPAEAAARPSAPERHVPSPVVAPASSLDDSPPVTPPAAPTQAPPVKEQAETTPAAEAPSQPATVTPGPAPQATPATSATVPVTADPTTTSRGTPPPADMPAQSTSEPDTRTSSSTLPVVTLPPSEPPPSSDPPPDPTPAAGTGNGSGIANGNGAVNGNGAANGVGRGGTPPGQGGTKPESRGQPRS